MATERQQLERLLQTANESILRMLWTRALPSPRNRLSRNLKLARKELFESLTKAKRVSTALEFLGIDSGQEIVPRSKWKLSELVGVNDTVLNHKHFREAEDVVLKRMATFENRICLFLPCHRSKPYIHSPTVTAVVDTLRRTDLLSNVTIFVISVPGIVPLELSTIYPFAYYEWDPDLENGSIIRNYTEAITGRVRRFLKDSRQFFQHYVTYFRPNSVESYAVINVATELGLPLSIVPSSEIITRIQSSNRAKWRFRGLKSQECLDDLSATLASYLKGNLYA